MPNMNQIAKIIIISHLKHHQSHWVSFFNEQFIECVNFLLLGYRCPYLWTIYNRNCFCSLSFV